MEYHRITTYASALGDLTLLQRWLRNIKTLDFIKEWEVKNNPNFNLNAYNKIIQQIGKASFLLSFIEFINETNAIGLCYKDNSKIKGIYAHTTIAQFFLDWIIIQRPEKYERFVAKQIAEHMGNRSFNQKTIHGNLSILTRNRIIQIKMQSNYTTALGDMIFIKSLFPRHNPTIVLIQENNQQPIQKEAHEVIKSMQIRLVIMIALITLNIKKFVEETL